jgi:arylsulfatase
MDDVLKPVLERQMEVYAGFLEHTDYHVGRLIDTLESIGALENTLVYYIVGDNGASAEGTVNGAFNEMANFNGLAAIETPEFMASVKDKLGSKDGYNHYSVGWAWAMCSPYQWTKQVASHWGGTRNGTIVHWPAGISSEGGTRSQFCHVIDVAPTVLEAAGLPEPTFVNGVQQAPIEGTSMLYTFHEADAPERHDLQYFEMAGNRGIYYKGWSAVTRHSTPWLPNEALKPLDEDVWELYDGATDWTQSRDLAAKMPERLAALQRLWLIEAVKYNVLPIDDRRFERLNPTIAGRPQLITGTTQVLFPGMKRLTEHSVLDVKNRSFTVTAAVETPSAAATNGVIIAQGGRFGGWALYVKEGRAKFVYNLLGMQEFMTEAKEELTPGSHQIRAEFAYDGGGLAKGGDVTLYYDGRSVGTSRVDRTQPMIFSADETTDIGDDFGMPVSTDYAGASKFNGRIDVVQIDVGADDHSHLIDPAEVARIAASRQ